MWLDGDWGDIPTWVGAFGTTGALLAAVWSSYDARNKNNEEIKALRLQQDRMIQEQEAQRLEREERERSQARLISVDTKMITDEIDIIVTNYSIAPVFAVEVVGVRFSPQAVDVRRSNRSPRPELGMIGPGEMKHMRVYPTVKDEGPSATIDLDPDYHIASATIRYVDSNGFRWERSGAMMPIRQGSIPAELPPSTADLLPIVDEGF